MLRRVRARIACPVLGGALALGAGSAPAANAQPSQAHVIALQPPGSPRLSLTLDGRDWSALPGVALPLPPVELPAGDTAAGARIRAGAEILVLLGVDAGYYWWGKTADTSKWELSWSWDSWRKKLLTMEAVSLDANAFETNMAWHPFGGTLYYLVARGNGLGMGESLLYSASGSALWEYVAEYPEKISLNDLVLTPLTGLAIGEPLHALGVLFERGERTVAHRLLAAALSPFRAMHRAVDGRPAARAPRLDERGLPDDVWRRIELSAGAGAVARNGGRLAPEQRIGASAELIQIPEYGRPGRVGRAVGGCSSCKAAVEVAIGPRGAIGVDVSSKTALGGYYGQDIARREGGELSGYSLFAGAATAFSYAWRDLSAREADKIGSAHVVGPSLDLTLHHRGVRVRAGIDAYADLAAVRAAALEAYLGRGDRDGIKTVLADRGYYFALGVTVAPSISVRHGGVEIGGEMRYEALESIEGLDRVQRIVTNDFHLQDRRLAYRARLAVAPAGERVELSLIEIEGLERSGAIGAHRRSHREIQARVRASLLF